MAKTSEEQFLDYVKQADSEADVDVYKDPPDTTSERTEAVEFSSTAQESSKEVREGVTDRLLPNKGRSDAAERALVGNILPQGETSSIQLKPVEKISFPRAQTLMEQTIGKLGRV